MQKFEAKVIRSEAEYRDGVLRPTTPVPLRDGERVRLIIARKPDPARWDLDRFSRAVTEDQALAEEGLATFADDLERLAGS